MFKKFGLIFLALAVPCVANTQVVEQSAASETADSSPSEIVFESQAVVADHPSEEGGASSVFDWDGSGWHVRSGDQSCVMLRIYEDNVALTVGRDPRNGNVTVFVGSEGWRSLRSRIGQTVRLDLGFSGANLDSDEFWHENALVAERKLGASVLAGDWTGDTADELLAAIAFSDGFALTIEDLLIGRYQLDGSRTAVTKLIECGRAIMESERDPFVRLSPPAEKARAPQPLNLQRIASNYPSAALREEVEGRVSVAIVVNPDGRVAKCTVTLSSGSSILDAAACEGFERYGRFEPALNATGEPVEGVFNTAINYVLPD